MVYEELLEAPDIPPDVRDSAITAATTLANDGLDPAALAEKATGPAALLAGALVLADSPDGERPGATIERLLRDYPASEEAIAAIELADELGLELSPDSVERFRHQFEVILELVSRLEEVDAGGVPPIPDPPRSRQPLRDDDAVPSLSREEALSNAPDTAHGLFRVPRVLGG